MHRVVSFFFILLVVGIILINQGCSSNYTETLDTVTFPIAEVVKKINFSHAYYQTKVAQKTNAFYEGNEFKKQWLDKKGSFKRFTAFVDEVEESHKYGMNPEDYDISQLESAVSKLYKNRKRTDADISSLDIHITASFFLFTTHLLEGRIRNPGAKDFIWKRGMPHEDDVTLLLIYESKRDLRKELDALQPKDPQYKKLQQALQDYRTFEASSHNLPKIPESVSIKPGDSNVYLSLIKKRLLLTDLASKEINDPDTALYDEALAEAVRKFQRRHGLKEDGVITRELVGYMNMPFKNMADVIALNLERLRWRPHVPQKGEYIEVNVPEYMLRIHEGKKKRMEMRVVLGSEFNATPIFSDTLKYIVFSPTWNVPKSILQEEFLPKLREDAAHYNEEFTFYKSGTLINPEDEDWNNEDINMGIYQAVQKPGPANSLGYVKFIMPNNFKIYLHDTPADRLFKKQERAFSHGCVRLERPLDLAEYLLRDQKHWNRKEIEAATKLDEPKHANLKKEYPVHITYRTAWVDDDGLVNFRKDIYGHDERQLAQLRKTESLLSYAQPNNLP
jgi:murein L,D-transpeptidase YcbB/YkuD